METLRAKQSRFMHYLARLIEFAYANGYELTGGELYRTPEQAQWNAEHGKGIANSLHTQRLAIDLALFRDGVYLTKSVDYSELGAFWKTLAHDTTWGGDFSKPDANHFSIEHGGVK